MTITRLAQYTAETRVTTDLASLFSLPIIEDDIKYTGGYSYASGISGSPYGHSAVPGLSAVRFGFWQYMVSVDIFSDPFLCFISNSNSVSDTAEQIHIRIDTNTSECNLRRPAVTVGDFEVLGTFTLPVEYTTTGAWFHVGFVVKIDETNGFFSMYLDGTRVFTYVGDTRLSKVITGVQTFATSAIYWLGPGAAGTSGIQGFEDTRIDDIFYDDITGEDDNPVPARRFYMVLPTANGEDTEWTPSTGTNYQNVDDNPNDANSTYNKVVDPDLRDTFVMGDFTLPADHRIIAAIPSPFARKLDSEVDSKLTVHAWDGSDYDDSPELDLTMNYNRPVFYRLTQTPSNVDWDEASFNAMQFGYQSKGEV